jgi:hypothetical protein
MIGRLGDWWRRLVADEGISHWRWEMVIMRVLMATVMFDFGTKVVALAHGDPKMTPSKLVQVAVIPDKPYEYKTQPHPNGIAHWVDLTFLSDPDIVRPLHAGFLAALAFYVAGIGLPVATGYLFLMLLAHGTFHNSQGSVHHHLQVVTLVLGLQWIASLRALFRPGTGWREWWRPGDWTLDRMTDWTRQAVVAAYVVSALSKLWLSKGLWMWKTPRFGIQLRKAMDQDYYDSLRHTTTGHEWLPEWCLDHPWMARMAFGAAVPLELFFFLALRNRRIAALYAIAMIGFHLSVSQLMSLDFRYNVQLLVIYFINVPFWFWVIGRWMRLRPLEVPVTEPATAR